jgi:DNA-binding CsgD family transcriptional regulator
VLREAHRAVSVVLQRLRTLHEERAVRELLEKLVRNSPASLLVLNGRLEPIVCNRAARSRCAQWNLGDAARTINSPEAFRIPPPVHSEAAALRQAWLGGHGNGSLKGHRVAHPERPELQASLEVLESRGSCLGSPLIRVQFHDDELPALNPKKVGTGPDLSRLTAQDVEVARLVGQGLTNQEIAARLSKSVFTVKTQVHTAFRKLGINRRAKLVLLFR